MGDVSALKQAVLDYLQRHAFGAMPEVACTAAHPAVTRSGPLRAPLVVAGVQGVALEEGGLGGYYGVSAGGAAYGAAAVVTLYFDLYAPGAQEKAGCHSLYEALCDALLLRDCPFGFLRVTCGETGYDKHTMAYRLRAEGALRCAVTRGDQSLMVRDFTVRREQDAGE